MAQLLCYLKLNINILKLCVSFIQEHKALREVVNPPQDLLKKKSKSSYIYTYTQRHTPMEIINVRWTVRLTITNNNNVNAMCS